MKKQLSLLLALLVLGFTSCDRNKTNQSSSQQPQSDTTIVAETTTTEPEKEADDEIPSAYLDAEIVYIEDGSLFFYQTATGKAIRFANEPDQVVNAVCTDRGLVYYNVISDNRLLLKRINLNKTEPEPTTLTDWNVELVEENEFGFPPYGNMYINKLFTQIALEVDITWLAGLCSNLAVYDCTTKEVTKLERYGDDWYDDMFNEDGFDIYIPPTNFNADLFESSDHLYYLGSGESVCLSDQVDEEDVTGFYEYGMDFEPVALNPAGTKLLYRESIGMGDGVLGFYAVSTLDGMNQEVVCDLYEDAIAPVWLSDGSLIIRGYESDVALFRVYPDGEWQTIAHTHKFCVLP